MSGESLASTEAQASDKNHVLDALGKVAFGVRNNLGESLNAFMAEQSALPASDAIFEKRQVLLGEFALLFLRLGTTARSDEADASSRTRTSHKRRR
jgi:hypothetical protein